MGSKRKSKGITGEAAQQRGLESEALVQELLEEYEKSGLISYFLNFDHNSEEDFMGIDFQVCLRDKKTIIDLQVKSSKKASIDASNKPHMKDIHIINARGGELRETLSYLFKIKDPNLYDS